MGARSCNPSSSEAVGRGSVMASLCYLRLCLRKGKKCILIYQKIILSLRFILPPRSLSGSFAYLCGAERGVYMYYSTHAEVRG